LASKTCLEIGALRLLSGLKDDKALMATTGAAKPKPHHGLIITIDQSFQNDK
jgi:hypothetical protein